MFLKSEMDKDQLIYRVGKGEPEAQKLLYDNYKEMLFTVCLRYSRDRSEAEDILHEGFILIFRDIKQFKGRGSLYGWMRKVMVHTALQYLRKWKKDWTHADPMDFKAVMVTENDIFDTLGLQELTTMIQNLPTGYRIIFNLFVIEGYSHKEIGQLLGISINTSKTQLFKAKNVLKKQLEKQLLTINIDHG